MILRFCDINALLLYLFTGFLGTLYLEHKQKLMKIADQSPYGWGTVVEYKANVLAFDSVDERRIEVRGHDEGQCGINGPTRRLHRGSGFRPYTTTPSSRRVASGLSRPVQSGDARRKGDVGFSVGGRAPVLRVGSRGIGVFGVERSHVPRAGSEAKISTQPLRQHHYVDYFATFNYVDFVSFTVGRLTALNSYGGMARNYVLRCD